ncbi:MAG: hypothetical protein V1690_04055 [Candidatus Moraniibacteriota bacterium]
METLGMKIRLHRTKCGLSQTALGRLLGKATVRLVSLWEADVIKPGSRYQRKLKAFLATDPAALRWCAARVGLVHKRKQRAQKLRRR